MTYDDPRDAEDEESYRLMMPFVVCSDHGGPYDATAFVAGCRFAKIDFTLRTIRPLGIGMFQEWVEPALIPQLDLLAMHLYWKLTTEPWEEHPDEWVMATFEVQELPE